jgi:hypothetical protein
MKLLLNFTFSVVHLAVGQLSTTIFIKYLHNEWTAFKALQRIEGGFITLVYWRNFRDKLR